MRGDSDADRGTAKPPYERMWRPFRFALGLGASPGRLSAWPAQQAPDQVPDVPPPACPSFCEKGPGSRDPASTSLQRGPSPQWSSAPVQ